MALADFLSAMRVLILDGPNLPAEPGKRRADLAGRFGRLSPAEIDDLAALSPERLTVYSDLVFAGERGTLRWAFPMSFAAIAAIEPDVEHMQLVRAMHRHRPWHSSSTRELAAIFQSYITQERRDWLVTWGGLADLIDYERVDLEVFYALDTVVAPWNAVEESRLRSLSVEALMNESIFKPSYAAAKRFGVDVLAIAERWQSEQTFATPLPRPSECLAACGRAPETFMPAWVRLTVPGYRALAGIRSDQPRPINELAAAYVEAWAVSSDIDEERVFADFYRDLVSWRSAGVLLAPPRA